MATSTLQQARINMVESQVRTNDVNDIRLLGAMFDLPRERFVPSNLGALAYIDEDLLIKPADREGGARYLMEPAPFAKLVELAKIGTEDLVLDIGCATGYSSAVLSRLGGSVVALEENAALAQQANEILPELDIGNVAVVSGALAAGYPAEGPYDVIFLNGSVETVPDSLLQQLKDGGRLVAILAGSGMGKACLYIRAGDTFSHRVAFDAAIKPLPGFEKAREFVL